MAGQRLLSLDVMRGLTVIGMIVVNGAAIYSGWGERPVYGTLLHADWHGTTLADLVFPFFIFIVGMSIPFALSSVKEKTGLTLELARRIIWRGTLLFIIGLGLTFYFYDLDGEKLFRLLGVLQRIGLVFIGAALIFMVTSLRVQVGLVAAILLLYWPLMFLPFPDGVVDLSEPGQNFVQWFDRAVLGGRVFAASAPFPYEPEGLISTLPAIAQALLGVLLGQWVKGKGGHLPIGQLLIGGMVLAALGWAWSFSFPLNKNLWSSSFVLWTSGLAILLFALLYYLLDVKSWGFAWAKPCQAFGINSIAGYVLHTLITGWVWLSPLGEELYTYALGFMSPEMALLLPVGMNVVVTWAPVAVLQHRKIIIKV
ncbi:MAG: acyltransferase family protein [Kordiimonas sp.]